MIVIKIHPPWRIEIWKKKKKKEWARHFLLASIPLTNQVHAHLF